LLLSNSGIVFPDLLADVGGIRRRADEGVERVHSDGREHVAEQRECGDLRQGGEVWDGDERVFVGAVVEEERMTRVGRVEEKLPDQRLALELVQRGY
jgi:hypothetical protein